MHRDNRKRYTQAEAVPTRTILQYPTQSNLFFPVHSRPQRLPGVDYTSADCLCFITFNVETACGVLLTEENGTFACNALQQQLQQIGCRVYAGCMMPDHVHLLLTPSGTGENISDIVGRVKSYMCLALRTQRQCYLKWQPSFYDHVLRNTERREEELNAVIHYIRANPEKAGLGDKYPYIL